MKNIVIYSSQTGNTRKIDWKPIADFFKKNVIKNFIKVSEQAETKGLFRRLVPLEDVGWHSYWYTVKNPPRLKPE